MSFRIIISCLLVSLSLVISLYIYFRKESPRLIIKYPLIYQTLPFLDNTLAYSSQMPNIDSIFSSDHIWIGTLSAERIRTIIVTGDVIPARVVNIKTFEHNNFKWSFEPTGDLLRSGDITFINLETPLIKDCPFFNDGFTFCGDARHIEGLLFAGVDVVSLANNHALNFGASGIEETTRLLQEKSIQVTGRGLPVIIDVRGLRFAFLGYNDIGKFSGITGAEESVIKEEIEYARKASDVVIVQYHWGTEYQSQPDTRQKFLGKFTIDSGADIVIGNHPHWIQPIQIYNNKLITYAHGNFVFDQMWSQKTREGVVGKYVFYDNQLIDVEYFPVLIEDYGQPNFLSGPDKEKILVDMKKESEYLLQN